MKSRIGFMCLIFIVVMILTGQLLFAADNLFWEYKNVMPWDKVGCSVPRMAEVNDKIYVFDGQYSCVREYTPLTDTWVVNSTMPALSDYYNVAAAENNKIYVVRGCSSMILSTLEYTPADGSWIVKSSMPVVNFDFAVTSVGNKVYVIGGSTISGSVLGDYYPGLKTVMEYNIDTDIWQAKADMSYPRKDLKAVVVDNKIYALGGFRSQYYDMYQITKYYLSTVEEYDIAQDTWVTKASMSMALVSFGAAVLSDKIYTIGGYSKGYCGGCPEGMLTYYHSTVDEYDPLANAWTVRYDATVTRTWGPGLFSVNSKLYVIFGDCASTIEEGVFVDDEDLDDWYLSGVDLSVKSGPNPATGNRVTFSGPGVYKGIVRIYNLAGELVRVLDNDENDFEIIWWKKDYNNNSISAGIYFYITENQLGKTKGKLVVK